MTTQTQIRWGVQAIGETAGRVWHYLRRNNGTVNLKELEEAIDAPKQLVYLAIGWLARENKVDLREERRSIHLWLTSEA